MKEIESTLVAFDVHEPKIPFRFQYGHRKARHRYVESVVCIVKDSEGNEGCGEAVPRTYVTGETVRSVRETIPALLRRLDPGSCSLSAFREKIRYLESDFYTGDVPACAICAVDLAMTDLYARQKNVSITNLLGNCSSFPNLEYTASIGISSLSKLVALLTVYRAMGLRKFKVKVGDEFDIERLRVIRKILGSDVSIFVDANGAWDKESAVKRIEAMAKLGVWAVEEPLQIHAGLNEDHFFNNAWLQSRAPLPLIADESLISLRTASAIVATSAFKIFNIRLSKCGGYTRATQFAELARQAGLSFSIGAMVGESPILATAGAAWGVCHPDHLYIQGHSHRILHGRTFTDGGSSLLRKGRSLPPRAVGSGVSVRDKELNQLSHNQFKISI